MTALPAVNASGIETIPTPGARPQPTSRVTTNPANEASTASSVLRVA